MVVSSGEYPSKMVVADIMSSKSVCKLMLSMCLGQVRGLVPSGHCICMKCSVKGERKRVGQRDDERHI